MLDYSPLPEFITCSMREFEAGEHHVTRVFNMSVLILMLDGVLRFIEDGNAVELTKGEYYIQRRGLFQDGRIVSDSPKYFYIHFNGSFSEEGPGLPVRGICPEYFVRSVVEDYDRLYRTHTATPFSLSSLLLNVFGELMIASPLSKTASVLASDIRNYINAEFSSEISVGSIALRYGYTQDHIIRIFKSEYNITPYQYVTSRRIMQAEYYLTQTNISVDRISREVGYKDFSTFYREFFKKNHVSPSAFRQSTKG